MIKIIIFLLLSANAYAESRIKQFFYQENKVFSFVGTTFIATQIILSPEEKVLNVEGGDVASWVVTRQPNLENMIFIKPTTESSNSNLTIITDKRNYYFHIRAQNSGPETYAIKFNYPAIKKERSFEVKINPLQHPERYFWHYRASGSVELIPLHIFDDGKFTYFEFTKNQVIPAIFAVEEKSGKENLVNVRRIDNFLVVQRLAPQFTLRHGKAVASVFNTREIARLKAGLRERL